MNRIFKSLRSTIKTSCNQKPGFLSDFHLSKLLNAAAFQKLQNSVLTSATSDSATTTTIATTPFIHGVQSRVIGRNIEHPVRLESITHAKSLIGTLSNQETYSPYSYMTGHGIAAAAEGDDMDYLFSSGLQPLQQMKPITINLSNTMQSILKKALKDSLLCVNVLKKRRKAMKKHKHRKRLRLNRKKKESNQI